MITREVKKFGKLTFKHDFSAETFLFRHEKFSQLIDSNCVVLDIGASSGVFTFLFASCANKVIAFEPNPTIYENFLVNLKNNPSFKNIVTYKLACTKETKKYTFNYTNPKIYGDGSNGGLLDGIQNTNFKQFHDTQIEVDGVNVTDFLNANHAEDINNIKFIKIDAEGYDKEILKTLAPIIEKNHPVLMVEAFKFLTPDDIKDYYNTIVNFGYKIYDISPLDNITDCAGPLKLDEFEHFIYNVCDNGNFICVHTDDVKKYNLPDVVDGKTCVVVFGRNDGYKEPERFYIHITTMLETFDEVIYIDWNSDKQSFLNEIKNRLPKTNRLKHFVIEPRIAKMMTGYDPKAQVCNTVLAFNIGLRRTDAEYIVLATTDIIPPTREQLQEFIKTSNRHSFYTFSRRDIEYNNVILYKDTLDNYRKLLDRTTQPRYFPAKVTPNDNYSIFNCCGDFQFATKNIWLKIRGYEEQMLYACFVDTNAQKKAVLYGFNLVPIYDIPLYHMSHTGMSNDGSSPSKQYYNDAIEWVEYFNKRIEHEHIMFSKNVDTWGFSDIEIEYELI